LEPKFKFPLTIGASGEMSLKVNESRKLLLKLVGAEKFLDQNKLVTYFRGIVMSKVKSYLANTIRESNFSIFELDEHLDLFSEALRDKLNSDFLDYGLDLVRFQVTTLAKPDGEKDYEKFKELFFRQYADIAEAKLKQEVEVIAANTEAQKVLIESDALAKKRALEGYNYQSERSFDVAEKVAGNEGSGSLTNLGIGLGLMAGVAGTIAQTTKEAIQPMKDKTIFCHHCGKPITPQSKFCQECGQPVLQKTGIDCPRCNIHYEENIKFCAQCGTKLRE
jgi:membrane protease subunit (stomatin/prohibitin family)